MTNEEEALELARRRLDELQGVAEKLPDRSVASERTLGSYDQTHLLLLAEARVAELRDETRRISEEPATRKVKAWFQWQRAIQKHQAHFGMNFSHLPSQLRPGLE